VYILLHIIIDTKVATETEEVGWVMEGTVCAEDNTFFYGGKKLFTRDRICLYIKE
jgi:hypothetical protein